MLRKIFSHSITALLFTGVMAGVTVGAAGCGAHDSQQQGPSAGAEAIGKLDAQLQTRQETGIDGWTITREGAGVLLDGRTPEGVSVHQVRLQPFSTTMTRDDRSEIVTGYDITTSGGGFVRVSRDERVLEYTPDDETFAAFGRDAQALPKGDVTLDCSVWAWIACSGAVLGAIAACPPPANLSCAAAILGIGSCLDCFAQATSGSSTPGLRYCCTKWAPAKQVKPGYVIPAHCVSEKTC